MSEFLVLDVNGLIRHAQAVPESVIECLKLGVEIGDEAARSEIESMGQNVVIDQTQWYDVSGLGNDEAAYITRARRYLDLRGVALAFRVIWHPALPNLCRFEAKV